LPADRFVRAESAAAAQAAIDAGRIALVTNWRFVPQLKGVQVVIMHRDQVYLCHWLGLVEVASIEPKPGVPPTAAYLGTLVGKLSTAPPRLILLNAYNDPKAANWLSERVHAPAVVLPFSVGGSPEARDLFGLFDDTINKLLVVLK